MASIKSALGRTLEAARQRSLFLKVVPMPATLTERRAVLRVLQRQAGASGIEMFKQQANGSSFIAVAASRALAKDLVDHSPLQFRFFDAPSDLLTTGVPGTGPPPGVAAPADPIELPRGAHPADQNPAATAAADGTGLLKTFTVHAFPAAGYNHKAAIRKSPLHGAWPDDAGQRRAETPVYAALSKVVPRGVAAEGLCDWRTGGQLGAEEPEMVAPPAAAAAGEDPRAVGADIAPIVEQRRRRRALKARREEMTAGSTLAGLTRLTALRPKQKPREDGD